MKNNENIFSTFLKTNVYCVFSLESPHRGDSNEYTHHTIISIKSRRIITNAIMFAAMGYFVRDSRTSSK